MADKQADDIFSSAFLLLLAVGGVMFIKAWIDNDLPAPLMKLIAYVFNAPDTGGK